MKKWIEDSKEIVWGYYTCGTDICRISSVACKDGTKPSGKLVVPDQLPHQGEEGSWIEGVVGFDISALNGCSGLTELEVKDEYYDDYAMPNCDGCTNLEKIVLQNTSYVNDYAGVMFPSDFKANVLSIQTQGDIIVKKPGVELWPSELPSYLTFDNGNMAYVYYEAI